MLDCYKLRMLAIIPMITTKKITKIEEEMKWESKWILQKKIHQTQKNAV